MKERLTSYTVAEAAKLLQAREVSARELTEAYVQRIEAIDCEVEAYLTVTAGIAMKQAKQIDSRRGKGEQLPRLAGIPMAIKDNICTVGIKTTCASRMLQDFVPGYQATAAALLEEQGVVLLGKVNMDEFAMGSTTETSYFHPTKNPRNFAHTPGGSSGGSGAAVAAEEAAFSLGSDTGGSIRQPAAFCGVVGMKPTYGTVSRYGLIAFASSLDQIGPLTKDVRDSAMVLSAIAAHDRRDATSLKRETTDFMGDLEKGVKGLRLALPRELFGAGISREVREAVLAAAKTLEGLGAVVEEISMPALSGALPAYYLISSAEASSNLSRFDGIRYGYRASGGADLTELYCKTRSEGFGKEVKRRIMLGTYALSAGYYDAYYQKALRVRTLLRHAFKETFSRYDAILSPVTPTTAHLLGEKRESPLELYRGDLCTVSANIAGIPALSMPCGTGEKGLPIGMQLMGAAFSEGLLYRIGYAYEEATGCYHRAYGAGQPLKISKGDGEDETI